MQFLLDLQALQTEPRTREIGRLSRGFAQAFLSGPQGADASVLLNLAVTQGRSARQATAKRPIHEIVEPNVWDEFENVREWLANCNAKDRIRVFRGLTGTSEMQSTNRARIHACEALYDAYVGSLGVELVHVPNFFVGFSDDIVLGSTEISRMGPARAVTIHDLIPFEAPENCVKDPVYKAWHRRRLAGLSKADLLVSHSAHIREVAIALLELAPDRVVNIGADADSIFRKVELLPEAKRSLLARYRISKPFVMHVGIQEPHNNVETLIRGFAQLPPERRNSHQLVLVVDATGQQVARMRAIARDSGVDANDVVFSKYAPDEDLVGLYGIARAVVVPSLAEGFGLTILEAMRCGAPVLAADAGSLPEIIGSREFLFSPTQPSAVAEKLTNLLTDESFRQHALKHCSLQERRYSWKITVGQAHEAFQEAVARRRVQRSLMVKKRPLYVLVPALDAGKNELACVDKLSAILGMTGDVVLTEPHARKLEQMSGKRYDNVGPENLNLADNHRIIILSGAAKLDLYQCAILARMPAVILLNEQTAEASVPAAWRYYLEGYSGLIASANSGCAYSSFDVLATIYHQVIGVVRGVDDPELASKIDNLYTHHPACIVQKVLAEIEVLTPADCVDVASAIAENHAMPPSRARLLVDISELVHRDIKTGIQRVVRNILRELLVAHCEMRVEPVYRDGDHYRYARQFTCRLLNLNSHASLLKDNVVDFYPSDTFLGLDHDKHLTDVAIGCLRDLRYRGGSVNFVVYDLLPLMRPEFFRAELTSEFRKWFLSITMIADRLIGISRCVADDISAILKKYTTTRAKPLEVTWYHNGSDLDAMQTNDTVLELADECADTLIRIGGRSMFLTVGTIEPRKGISELLDAAEYIWRDHDIAFVLVGAEGWLVDELMDRIKNHAELGKRLFWLGHISDELLARLYRRATAVILPSEAEGFGLPLIEAARHGTPIIARDIPIFREVGGGDVFYFKSKDGRELAMALGDWLTKLAKNQIPRSENIKVLSWGEAATQLLDATQGKRPYHR